jgi:hypothetical protein
MKMKCLLELCAWVALSELAPGVLANSPAIEASVHALEGGQALLAIETHRAAIVERLVAEYAEGLAQRGLDADTFRESLNALRADQLLAATLVSTLDEVLRVMREPALATGPAGQRYVAITPTEAIELRAVPDAQAYLVRDGEALSVVKAAELQLTGRNRVVGYFAPSMTSVTINASTAAAFVPKDGSGSGSGSWIGYTAGGNQATGLNSAVAAGSNNLASAQGAFVGAGTANQANGISSLVIGGFDNRAVGIDSLVGAGAGHRATGARSVIVGGGYNLASGPWSFIGGGGRDGIENTPAGTNALDNVAAGIGSTIGGGQGNRSGGPELNFTTVTGGLKNTASGPAGTVGGGYNNTASGAFATVAGGFTNTAGPYANVSGGYNNTASGDDSAVGGGISNTTSGLFATVPGGYSNIAGGDYSFAAGYRAHADSEGCFVWNDHSATSENNCGGVANRVVMRASGGFFFLTHPSNVVGATLSPGATAWSTFSDRRFKDYVRTVDGRRVLRKLAAMPISTWNWKSQDPGIRHMGPMAQDFRAAFGLGESETHISTVDADGVALAAIQGLHAELRERDARVARQNAKITSLERVVDDLKRAVDALAAKR